MKETVINILRSPAAGSAARWVVAFLTGLVGVRLADQEAGEIAAAVLGLVVLLVSVWFSRRSDAKQVETAVKTVADLKGEMLDRGREAAKGDER